MLDVNKQNTHLSTLSLPAPAESCGRHCFRIQLYLNVSIVLMYAEYYGIFCMEVLSGSSIDIRAGKTIIFYVSHVGSYVSVSCDLIDQHYKLKL